LDWSQSTCYLPVGFKQNATGKTKITNRISTGPVFFTFCRLFNWMLKAMLRRPEHKLGSKG
jgi:hypothetical protein